jgi:ABC-2 type transport system ATP-binding protein
VLACQVTLRRADPAIAKALSEWGFKPHDGDGGVDWRGEVAGADRLRFMGLVSRYVGLLTRVHFEERHAEARLQVVAS